jgi:hypothetical protein
LCPVLVAGETRRRARGNLVVATDVEVHSTRTTALFIRIAYHRRSENIHPKTCHSPQRTDAGLVAIRPCDRAVVPVDGVTAGFGEAVSETRGVAKERKR